MSSESRSRRSPRRPPDAPRLARFRYRVGRESTRVVVGPGALGLLGDELAKLAPGRWLVVSSRPVLRLHNAALARALGFDLSPLLLPDGEAAKRWDVLGTLLDDLLAAGLKRDGGVVAFGGGTVGDVAGLAGALALRGVPVVQVPTTLLAASDSALGGKSAVDLAAGKNLAGVVRQPALVLADTALLETLDERAYRSGLAEVVKCSFLDAAFDRAFERLEPGLSARAPEAVAEAVVRSLRLKARVVESDPEEATGARFVLNLGHTIGHALESASRHRMTHGEAVAWGLLGILRLSVRAAGLAERDAARLARRIRLLVAPPRPGSRVLATWAPFLSSDKKSDSTGLRAVLLAAPGRTSIVRCTAESLREALGGALEG